MTSSGRPSTFAFRNGNKTKLPFSDTEYQRRLSRLRKVRDACEIPVAVMTSMHNIAYYSGFLYCAFGRPYACVITQDACTTVSANIDGGQPWRRSVDDNLVYTDWRRDNFWRAVADLAGAAGRIGVEGDHLTLAMRDKAAEFLSGAELVDLAPDAMAARMVKSAEEIALIRDGARVADIGGRACRAAIAEGAREIDVAIAGRDAMEREIARAHPGSELRDTWVWFQSGLNTDGAHNPVTAREIRRGDILSTELLSNDLRILHGA